MEQEELRILSPQEFDALTPDEQRAYMRRLAHRAVEKNRQALDMLANYDRDDAVAARRAL